MQISMKILELELVCLVAMILRINALVRSMKMRKRMMRMMTMKTQGWEMKVKIAMKAQGVWMATMGTKQMMLR